MSLCLNLTSVWIGGMTLISFSCRLCSLCLGREKASWVRVGRQPLWLVSLLVARMRESPKSLGGKETAKEILEL